MIVDCHVHFSSVDLYDKMMDHMRITGLDQLGVQVTPRCGSEPNAFKQAEGFWLKTRLPESVFLFGGLDYGGVFDAGRDEPDVPLVEQLDKLIAAGCDGLKMLSGKPTTRKTLAQPLDGPMFQALYNRLEETGFPLLWHVGDPPEFWNPQAVPLWAKQHKWWYDDTYPPKELIDREIAAVLNNHPKLNLILPHFFFLSQDLDAAAALLESHPNVCLDLAPGVEMLHNFTEKPDQAREFFLHYAGRILLGTDSGMGMHVTGPKRGWMVRHWLETDDEFDVPDDPFMTPDDRPALKGIALPPDAIEQICCDNFHRIVGSDRPKSLNPTAAGALLRELSTRRANCGGDVRPAQEAMVALGVDDI